MGDGPTVVVTGAALGLGRAIALRFAAQNAQVWGCDIQQEGLAETAAMEAGRIETRVVDVTDRAAVQDFVAAAEAATGRIDILVNDAGGLCGQRFQPIEDLPEEDWHVVLNANLTGAYLCTQAVVPTMKRAGYGRIVNIASGAGLTTTVTGIQAYASAKAGLIGLTRQLAQELGPFGITVNAVAPGSIPCNPYSLGRWNAMDDAGRAAALSRMAMRRVGRAEDVVHAVGFFADAAAGWITGQTLSVDGGKQ